MFENIIPLTDSHDISPPPLAETTGAVTERERAYFISTNSLRLSCMKMLSRVFGDRPS